MSWGVTFYGDPEILTPTGRPAGGRGYYPLPTVSSDSLPRGVPSRGLSGTRGRYAHQLAGRLHLQQYRQATENTSAKLGHVRQPQQLILVACGVWLC